MPTISLTIAIIIAAAAAIVAAVIAFLSGVSYRKRKAEATIGSAEAEAKRILNDAYKGAEAKKKESILEAKDEIHKMRSEADQEIRERRNEVKQQERRIVQKEEALDRKIENMEAKEEALAQKSKVIDERMAEVDQLKKGQLDMLERISGFSIEQAKDYLLKSLDEELTHEKALRIMNHEQKLKDESDKLAA